jgi:nicotinamide mononucleotide transporter
MTWPLGILATAAYALVFWNARLFADFTLQWVFIGQALWGWLVWSRTQRNERPPRAANFRVVATALGAMLLMTPLIVLLLRQVPSARHVVLDAALTSGSVIATVLLVRSYAMAWACWMLVDMGYVALGAASRLTATSVLYAGLALWAAVQWWRWSRQAMAAAS